MLINAGHGHKRSSTRLDFGWTGFTHNVDVIDYSIGGVLLENCNSNCDNCDFRIDKTIGTCRCSNDVTIECSTVEAADVACGGNNCNCFFGPPLALSAGGTRVCAVNRFAQEFTGGTGTVGEYNVQSTTRARVHQGLSLTKPCPTCVGDPTRNDGIRGGTCSGAACHCSQCPGNNCGTCTIPGERSCFLPTVSATGKPGIFNGEGVSAFCSAQTTYSPVNTAGGLPGPGRVRPDFDFNIYRPDGVSIMRLPGDLNCP